MPTAVLPSGDDPVVAAAVERVGGPPGRHARLDRRRFWTPVRCLVLLTLLTSLLGFWQKSPCRTNPWADSFQYTHACYTDVYALWFAERLDEGATPYLEHPVEYPVVIGAVMAVAAQGAELFPEEDRGKRFYDLTWVLLTAGAVVVVVTTARLAGRRPWDAALFAVSPALVLHGSVNWDLVAMALAGLALVQWARRNPAVAGVLLGAATATKLYPVLFLLPIAVLCLRAGRLRAFWPLAAAALVTPVLMTAPVYLLSPSFAEVDGAQLRVADSPLSRLADQGPAALAPHVEAVLDDGRTVVGVNAAYRFVELNTLRPANWESVWFVLQTARDGATLDPDVPPGEPPSRLNAASGLLFVVGAGAVAVLAWRAPVRPRLPQLLFLVVLAFLLSNKVWSPQFSLWLVPLYALALPRWRPFLVWMAADAALLLLEYWFFVGQSDPSTGVGTEVFVLALLLRDAVLVGIAALVVRGVLRPEHDVVRRDGVDDPAGGVLDGAPDARPR